MGSTAMKTRKRRALADTATRCVIAFHTPVGTRIVISSSPHRYDGETEFSSVGVIAGGPIRVLLTCDQSPPQNRHPRSYPQAQPTGRHAEAARWVDVVLG